MASRAKLCAASVEPTTGHGTDSTNRARSFHRNLQAAHFDDLLRSLQKWDFRRNDYQLARLETERLARLKETHLTNLRQSVGRTGQIAEQIQEQAARIRTEVLPKIALYSERHVSGQEKLEDFFRRDVPCFRAPHSPQRKFRLVDARKVGRLSRSTVAIARESGFIDEIFREWDFSDEAVAAAKRFLEDDAIRRRVARISPSWSQPLTFGQDGGPDAYTSGSAVSDGCIFTATRAHSCSNKHCLQVEPGDRIAVFHSGRRRRDGLKEGYRLAPRDDAPSHGFVDSMTLLDPIESAPADEAYERLDTTSSCDARATDFECDPERMLDVTEMHQMTCRAVADCTAVIAAATLRLIDDAVQQLDHLQAEQAHHGQEQNVAIATFGQTHNSWVRATAREAVQLEQLEAAEEHLWEEILMLVLLSRGL